MSMQEVINRAWTIKEIVAQYPQSVGILAEWGFHCAGCSVGMVESLGDACAMHGLGEEDVALLLEDLNEAAAAGPVRDATLYVSKNAAEKIYEIAKSEHAEGQGLSVQANEDGSFFMEFRATREKEEQQFHNRAVPEVKVWASLLTLQRIGGATIAFEDGRFKLELEQRCCKEVGEGT